MSRWTKDLPDSPGSRPLRILTITPFYPIEGDDAQGCFVADSVSALEAAGLQNEVFAVAPFYRKKFKLSKSAPSAVYRRFFSFPGGFGLPSSGDFLASALWHEVRTLHQVRPFDLIHAHAALPCGHAAFKLARRLGIPFAVTAHGLDVFFTNQVRGFWGSWCKKVSQEVYRAAAKTICISGKVRDCILSETEANTEVVYNGVDPSMFAPPSSLEKQDFILSVGNLIPIKGHELLLRAFAHIYEQFPTLRCAIIGDGTERIRLENVARDLKIQNRVSFLGRQSRESVATAMAGCTLFALPSSYEGLGCVYLEAMAAGKPIIACTGQGISEVIEHGRNGLLISLNSLPEMIDSIVRLLQNPDLRVRMGHEARQTVLQEFTFSRQAQRLLQVYRECIA